MYPYVKMKRPNNSTFKLLEAYTSKRSKSRRGSTGHNKTS